VTRKKQRKSDRTRYNARGSGWRIGYLHRLIFGGLGAMNYLLNFTSVNAVASGNSSEVAGKSIIEASRKSNGDKPRENRGFGRA
jgi:hypothetical protein